MTRTALRVDVDYMTGWRAGGIDPRDPGLRGNPLWQHLPTDGTSGWEIRLIVDGRDPDRYRGVPGVVVLEGDEAIEAALAEIPEREVWTVADSQVAAAHLRAKHDNPRDPFTFDELAGLTPDEFHQRLGRLGVAGVARVDRPRPTAERVAQTPPRRRR